MIALYTNKPAGNYELYDISFLKIHIQSNWHINEYGQWSFNEPLLLYTYFIHTLFIDNKAMVLVNRIQILYIKNVSIFYLSSLKKCVFLLYNLHLAYILHYINYRTYLHPKHFWFSPKNLTTCHIWVCGADHHRSLLCLINVLSIYSC